MSYARKNTTIDSANKGGEYKHTIIRLMPIFEKWKSSQKTITLRDIGGKG
jgi:hypothetical protein